MKEAAPPGAPVDNPVTVKKKKGNINKVLMEALHQMIVHRNNQLMNKYNNKMNRHLQVLINNNNRQINNCNNNKPLSLPINNFNNNKQFNLHLVTKPQKKAKAKTVSRLIIQ